MMELKSDMKDKQKQFKVAHHKIEEQLKKAIQEFNLLYSRGLQMERDFPFFSR